MKFNQASYLAVLGTLCWIIGGCELLSPEPEVLVTGRVVSFRSKIPIAGVSVMTYESIFNCGSLCSTHELRDSTGTDANGYFSFKASKTNLELSIFKKGYLGLFPGEGHITQFTQVGNNDYKVIGIKPLARIVVKYVVVT